MRSRSAGLLALAIGVLAWGASTSSASAWSPPSEAKADPLETQRALVERYEAEGKYQIGRAHV